MQSELVAWVDRGLNSCMWQGCDLPYTHGMCIRSPWQYHPPSVLSVSSQFPYRVASTASCLSEQVDGIIIRPSLLVLLSSRMILHWWTLCVLLRSSTKVCDEAEQPYA
jgi:hypothetical protein